VFQAEYFTAETPGEYTTQDQKCSQKRFLAAFRVVGVCIKFGHGFLQF